MIKITLNENTYLKSLEKFEAAELFDLVDNNRSYLRKWLPWLDFTRTVQDSEVFIGKSLERYQQNKGFELGIWYKGQLAGVIGMHDINWDEKKTSLGYWLGESFQGHGLVTSACQAVLSYSFETLGLETIEIRCAIENSRSVAIPERLGFKKTGVREKAEWLYDHFVDHFIFEIDKSSFSGGQ